MLTKHRFLLVLALLTVLSACKAAPAKPAGFLENPEEMTESDSVPFHRAWVKPDVDWASYTSMIIAPVNTEHLLEMDWLDKTERSEEDIREDAREIGEYARQALQAAYAENGRFALPTARGPGTLVLEFAVVQLVPSKAVLNALMMGASVVTPPGTGAVVGEATDSKGSVAFEARYRDAQTNEVVAKFADREAPKASLFNIKDYQWYAHTRTIMDEWAEQLVLVSNLTEDGVVDDSLPFDLLPW